MHRGMLVGARVSASTMFQMESCLESELLLGQRLELEADEMSQSTRIETSHHHTNPMLPNFITYIHDAGEYHDHKVFHIRISNHDI